MFAKRKKDGLHKQPAALRKVLSNCIIQAVLLLGAFFFFNLTYISLKMNKPLPIKNDYNLGLCSMLVSAALLYVDFKVIKHSRTATERRRWCVSRLFSHH